MSVDCSSRPAPRDYGTPDLTLVTSSGTIVVFGELDIDTAPVLIEAIDRVIVEQPTVRLVLDLAGVTFMSAAGIGALLLARDAMLRAGGELSLNDPSPPVWLALARTGDIAYFAVEPAPEPA